MDLSILYFGHIGFAVDFMGEADRLGFGRFWLGEHHSQWQCANPLLLGALMAATSSGIRLGSGGVCINYHSPLRVAEDARLIEYMVPGRFDLGVTRGLKLDPELRDALFDGRQPETLRPYDEKLADLHGYVTGRLAPADPLAGQMYLEGGPPMWLLGTSTASAEWAASHGTGFCFSLHHGRDKDGVAALREYRRQFVPSAEFAEPRAMVVASMLSAPTRDAALADQKEKGFDHVSLVGPPADCVAGLEEIAASYGVDEVMILDLQAGHIDEVSEKYGAIADLAGLAPRGEKD